MSLWNGESQRLPHSQKLVSTICKSTLVILLFEVDEYGQTLLVILFLSEFHICSFIIVYTMLSLFALVKNLGKRSPSDFSDV